MKKILILLVLASSLFSQEKEIIQKNICEPYLKEVDRNLDIANTTVGIVEKEFFGLLSTQSAILYQLKYNECMNNYRFKLKNNSDKEKKDSIKDEAKRKSEYINKLTY